MCEMCEQENKVPYEADHALMGVSKLGTLEWANAADNKSKEDDLFPRFSWVRGFVFFYENEDGSKGDLFRTEFHSDYVKLLRSDTTIKFNIFEPYFNTVTDIQKKILDELGDKINVVKTADMPISKL